MAPGHAPPVTPRSPRSGHRLHHPAPPSSPAARGRPQGPLCAGSCRVRIPTRGWLRPSPRTGRGRSRARSADGQGCLHRKAPPRPGGDRGPTTAQRGCGGPRAGWRTQSESPPPGRPRRLATWVCARGRLSPSNNCPGPCPSKTPAGGSGRHEVSFCTAGGVAYLGAGARARKARGGRRTGARGPAAWWGARLSGCAGGGLRGGLRPGSWGGGPGASAGREAGAAALARAPPPPSLPQPSPPSPGAAAAPARRPGRPGCRRSGQPRRAVWAEAGQPLRPRLWLRDTSRAEAPPRAGKLLPVASTPSLPFLAPARGAPLSSSPHSSPSPPFPAPARLPHGPLTARRGGPSSAPRGDRPETRGRGHPGGSRFRRTWRPERGSKSRGGVCRAFLAAWACGKAAGHAPSESRDYLGLLNLRGRGEPCSGSLVFLPKAALAREAKAPARVTVRRVAPWGTWGVEAHLKHTLLSFKFCPLTRI